ncbi:MAG: RNA-directed DNA polymerase [Chloroflexota bacterium]|nr:RNA-directed DNA polymerase [Chloroflexota bacterium]
MSLDKQYLLNALLRHNYFPSHQKHRDELPPLLDSTSLSPTIARQLRDLPKVRRKPHSGYDAVEYRLTRFNNVPRVCSIPHPKAYSTLALRLATDWDKIAYITDNPRSQIIPRQHDDGRVMIMNYQDSAEQIARSVRNSFGRQYIVKTDISNCYPSIYSHAVPWAAVGIAEAKKHIGKRSKWYNKLDHAITLTRRNETMGIAIGPATSAIVAEIILARVDLTLDDKFKYTRFMDDYTAFCLNREEAEEFLFSLSRELSKFQLLLNVGKTATVDTPSNSSEFWVSDLRKALPQQDSVTLHSAVDYLDFALDLSKRRPDGSVLKYALRSLVPRLVDSGATVDERAIDLILDYSLNLCFHFSALVTMLEQLFDISAIVYNSFVHGDRLQQILLRFTRMRQSDAISWCLYFCLKYRVAIPEECASGIIKSGDCIPMVILYWSGNLKYRQMVIDFANTIDRSDLYKLDQYWLLLYEVYRDDEITNPYGQEDRVFEVMKSAGISFTRPVADQLPP